jgi:hypothetical protein
MRLTVFLLACWLRAIVRQLQWVAPVGLVCKVAATIAATCSGW